MLRQGARPEVDEARRGGTRARRSRRVRAGRGCGTTRTCSRRPRRSSRRRTTRWRRCRDPPTPSAADPGRTVRPDGSTDPRSEHRRTCRAPWDGAAHRGDGRGRRPRCRVGFRIVLHRSADIRLVVVVVHDRGTVVEALEQAGGDLVGGPGNVRVRRRTGRAVDRRFDDHRGSCAHAPSLAARVRLVRPGRRGASGDQAVRDRAASPPATSRVPSPSAASGAHVVGVRLQHETLSISPWSEVLKASR